MGFVAGTVLPMYQALACLTVGKHALRFMRFLTFAGLTALSTANGASAAGALRVYPVKAVRLIVAAPPGGAADTIARLIAPKLGEIWGQAVVIDNRPGANGIIGTEKAARAAADGYTLVLVSASLGTILALHTRVPYDPVRDFAPVTQIVSVPHVLIVQPALGVSSFAELLSSARTKPGSLVFASAGKGTTTHLALELLQQVAATRFVHAPAKGASAALNDLIGAQAHAVFSVAAPALPHVQAGRLKALAITSAKRSSFAPALPTIAESGLPGFEVVEWYGVLSPRHTPDAIVAKLNADINRALRLPEIEQRLLALATNPIGSLPAEFADYIALETRRWTKIIKSAAIKPD